MSIFSRPWTEVTTAAIAEAYAAATEHHGGEDPQIYGGFGGKPRGCTCGCTPEEWLDLFARYEDGEWGEVA